MTLRVIVEIPAHRLIDVLEALHALSLTAADILCDEPSSPDDSAASRVVVTLYVADERLAVLKRVLAVVGVEEESITIFESALTQ